MLPLNISVLILRRILVDNVLELKKMSERGLLKRTLENEEDKKKIEETFTRINEHTTNFHVSSSIYLGTTQS